MRRNAADYQAHDVDADGKLDFNEFCAMVREREDADHTDEELRERFEELDQDKSGLVDMSEYVLWALRDALARSSARVIDLFRQWDEDGSGEIDQKEFRQAVQAMGFDFGFEPAEIDRLFSELDVDGSGQLDYKELNKVLRDKRAAKGLDPMLQAGAAGEIVMKAKTKYALRRRISSNRTALVMKGEIDASSSDKTVAQQLRDLLTANAVRVIDLFRQWDEDGSGDIDKGEFRKGMEALGVKGTRADINALVSAPACICIFMWHHQPPAH
jgi:Ca2+-binding EF-hand superfamily protein